MVRTGNHKPKIIVGSVVWNLILVGGVTHSTLYNRSLFKLSCWSKTITITSMWHINDENNKCSNVINSYWLVILTRFGICATKNNKITVTWK